MFLRRLLDKPPRRQIGARFSQRSLQFAYAQIVILRDIHHHEAVLASYRNNRLGMLGQHGFDGGYPFGFQIIGR